MASSSGSGWRADQDLRGDLGAFSAQEGRIARVLGSVPWATLLIIALNLLVFVVMAIRFATVRGFSPLQLTAWGGNSGALDLAGQWWRLLTYQFLHADIVHVAVNMWVMWSVGRLTERLYGSATLLFLYLAGGALAGLTSIIWNPMTVSVGASGSIFAVLGAFLAVLLRLREEVPLSILRYWLPALIFVGYNLFAGAYRPAIDNAAHVGGLVAGFALGLALVRPLEARGSLALRGSVLAIVLVGAMALPPLWYLNAFDRRPSTFETFAASHHWYMDQETPNLVLWMNVVNRMRLGTISDDDARAAFSNKILPFWKSASSRLQAELRASGRDRNPFLPEVAEFAKLRLGWARAIIAALRERSPQSIRTVFSFSQKTDLEQAALDRLRLRGEADTMPIPLSESAIAITLKSLMPGLGWRCVVSPYDPKPSLSSDGAEDGPAQRHAAGCAAQRMFLSGDYAGLERAMKADAGKLFDLPDGSSHLEGVWRGLSDLFAYGELPPNDVMLRTSQWRRTVKGSVEPDLVEVLAFRAWAYQARGHGYISSVSQQAQALYLERTAMAEDGLHEVAAAAKGDPEWYVLSLGVDRDRAVPLAEQRRLFDRSQTRFRGYRPLYNQMLLSLMPRWGGSTDAVDKFIRDAARKSGKMDLATYARLYLIYGYLEGQDFDVVSSAKANSILMTEGGSELRRRYPHSDYVVNAIARFLCIDNDGMIYRSLRPSLDGHVSTAAWRGKLSLAQCDIRYPRE